MLRALLFAALFAAVLAVVYTKSTSAEDVIKKLDANQEKLDQLNARIQNLKNKLKARVAAREEADRKSKNMLLRLDRMDIKDGSYHCHKSTDGRQTNFKCRTGQQCVPNILVCDNKVDCEDGSDEDEDFCKLFSNVGDTWDGIQVSNDCEEKGAPVFSATFTSIRKAESMANYLTVDFSAYYPDSDDSHVKVTSYAQFLNGTYDFGMQEIRYYFNFKGISYLVRIPYMPAENVMYMKGYFATSRVQCSTFVLKKRITKDVEFRLQ